MQKERKFHYSVLYTQVRKQAEVRAALKDSLPEGRGTVFYPCMEWWRRDSGRIEVKPLFPGYVFIRSDMDILELHGFIREHRGRLGTFIRELGLDERRISGDGMPGGRGGRGSGKSKQAAARKGKDAGAAGKSRKDAEKEDEDAGVVGGSREDTRQEGRITENTEQGNDGDGEDSYELEDLSDEEAAFLDFLLGINGTGDGSEGSGKGSLEGILRMSYGYREDGKYVVMEGPLKGYADRIASVDRHERRAYLDFSVGGRMVRAGFEVKPKRHWFPEDGDAPEVLSDGTEVDLQALKKKMMGG